MRYFTQSIPLLIIAAVIAIIVYRKRKEKKRMLYFTEKIRRFSEVKFPELYFEKLFFGYLGENATSSQEDIDVYKRSVEKFLNTVVPLLSKSLDEIEKKSKGNSIFYTTQDEIYELTKKRSPEEVNEKISNDIRNLILYVCSVKTYMSGLDLFQNTAHASIQYLKNLYTSLLSDAPNEEALNAAEEGYNLALRLQWVEICKENPKYNTAEYFNAYMNISHTDTVAADNWKLFWCSTFNDIYTNIARLPEQYVALTQLFEHLDKYEKKNWYACVVAGYNQYSSLYELLNDKSLYGDSKEVLRIHEAYENGEIKGAYKKSKDPKFMASYT